MWGERPSQRPQRPSSMAYCVLLLICRLPKCLANLIAEEVRVVPETSVTARLLQNSTTAIALAYGRYRAKRREVVEHAAVARQTARRRSPGEPTHQFGVVRSIDLGLAAFHPTPSFGVDPWSATQGEHFETRIIGKGGQRAQAHEILGLEPGVDFEALPRLQRISGGGFMEPDFVGKYHREARPAQDPANLPLLARAAGGGKELHSPSAVRCARNSWVMPPSARPRMVSSWAREKVPCSPVPCTSTYCAGSSITMFESTAASLSST